MRSSGWAALCAWSLTATSAFLLPSAVHAESLSINIPAGPIAQSLRLLSIQTGASVGFSGPLPQIDTRPVKGAASAGQALRQMLKGTGYRATATGAFAFRIVPISPVAGVNRSVILSRVPQSRPEPEIVVTALKRPEPLSTLPGTVHVIQRQQLSSAGGIAGSDELEREVPALSLTSMGPGRNRIFLRGIGDGPLNGFNQGSVAILLDEARLNYDAPDPDWALIDIRQVEVLEGPQGPLYGTGALGGIVKISTNRPELSHFSGMVRASLAVSEDGDLSNSQSAVVNVPLVTDKLALRAVAYRQVQAGWIENVAGSNDSNREALSGARVGIRWLPSDRWTVDLTGALQNRRTRDSQYVDGNLGPLRRSNRSPEPRDLDARLAMLTVKGPIGGFDFTAISSFSRHQAVATYDATPLAARLGTSGTTIVGDERDYRVFDQEVRVANKQHERFEWLAGASLINATTNALTAATDVNRTVSLLAVKRSILEGALFAQASYSISPNLSLGAGARIFSTHVDDDGTDANARSVRSMHSIKSAGDITLTWKPAPWATVFFRGATAYRPGGTNVEPDAAQATYQADDLAGAELGSRIQFSRTLSFAATVFAAKWRHVQADELLSNGLVATTNAGNGSNFGGEADLRWSLGSNFGLSAGMLAQSAMLDTSGTFVGIEDRRLPAVPQMALHLQADHRFQVAKWDGQASIGFRYWGATHLSFDPALDHRTPRRATVDASLRISRQCWTMSLVGENLANSHADTFAFGNPFRIGFEPQRTPTRPRTMGLSIARSF